MFATKRWFLNGIKFTYCIAWYLSRPEFYFMISAKLWISGVQQVHVSSCQRLLPSEPPSERVQALLQHLRWQSFWQALRGLQLRRLQGLLQEDSQKGADLRMQGTEVRELSFGFEWDVCAIAHIFSRFLPIGAMNWWQTKSFLCAVDVAQVVEQTHPYPEIRGSKPIIFLPIAIHYWQKSKNTRKVWPRTAPLQSPIFLFSTHSSANFVNITWNYSILDCSQSIHLLLS